MYSQGVCNVMMEAGNQINITVYCANALVKLHSGHCSHSEGLLNQYAKLQRAYQGGETGPKPKTPGAATGCPENSIWAQIYAYIQDTRVQCTNNSSEPYPRTHFETAVEDHIDFENFGVGENQEIISIFLLASFSEGVSDFQTYWKAVRYLSSSL